MFIVAKPHTKKNYIRETLLSHISEEIFLNPPCLKRKKCNATLECVIYKFEFYSSLVENIAFLLLRRLGWIIEYNQKFNGKLYKCLSSVFIKKPCILSVYRQSYSLFSITVSIRLYHIFLQ